MLTNFTTQHSNSIVIIPLIIHKFYVRPDLVQPYGTVTYILLAGFIFSLKMAFKNPKNISINYLN